MSSKNYAYAVTAYNDQMCFGEMYLELFDRFEESEDEILERLNLNYHINCKKLEEAIAELKKLDPDGEYFLDRVSGRLWISITEYDDSISYFSIEKKPIIRKETEPKKNRMLIITGEAGSGKDTLAQHLKSIYEKEGAVIHTVTFASKLKEEAKALGWDGIKDQKGRDLLQDLGKLMKNYHGSRYYAEQAFVGREQVEGKQNVWIVTDARFLVEIEHCREFAEKNDAEVKIIRVDRSIDPNWVSALTEAQKKDVSEQEWRQVDPDVIVQNDGTDPTFKNFKI